MVTIRSFSEGDAAEVRALFICVNRLLAPPNLRAAFETYVRRSLAEEMGRVSSYYAERGGGFWVAVKDAAIVGMFGLEAASPNVFELRRMYVKPFARRAGIASAMLRFAEDESWRQQKSKIVLSTSDLQSAAIHGDAQNTTSN